MGLWNDISRNKFSEIINTATVKLIEKDSKVKSFKIVLIFEFNDIEAKNSRYVNLLNNLRALHGQFKCINGNILDSIGLVITKIPERETQETVRTLLNTTIYSEVLNRVDVVFFKHILESNKFELFYHPSQPDVTRGVVPSEEVRTDRELIFKFIHSLKPWNDKNVEVFSHSIPANIQLELEKDIKDYLKEQKTQFESECNAEKNLVFNNNDLFSLDYTQASNLLDKIALVQEKLSASEIHDALTSFDMFNDKFPKTHTRIAKVEQLKQGLKVIHNTIYEKFSDDLKEMQTSIISALDMLSLPILWSRIYHLLHQRLEENVLNYGFKVSNFIDKNNFKNHLEEYELLLPENIDKLKKGFEDKETIQELMFLLYKHIPNQELSRLGRLSNKDEFVASLYKLFSESKFLKQSIQILMDNTYYNIATKDSNGGNCQISGKYITTIEIQGLASGCQTINVLATPYFIVNCDLFLTGVNLKVSSPTLIVSKIQSVYNINLVGKTGESYPGKPTPCSVKEKGKDGRDGEDGGKGGNFDITFDSLLMKGASGKYIIVNTNGGNGGHGQDGGDGCDIFSGKRASHLETDYSDFIQQRIFVSNYLESKNKEKQPVDTAKRWFCSSFKDTV